MRGVLSIYLLAPFPPFTYFSSYLSTLFNHFRFLSIYLYLILICPGFNRLWLFLFGLAFWRFLLLFGLDWIWYREYGWEMAGILERKTYLLTSSSA